ncbi:MAG TPA: TniB family NTP-binding protein [Candidatus Methylomirabilis sp.]|nr:TniB family NTP-binding protein [Candidatus Methylomirabilis sp.]
MVSLEHLRPEARALALQPGTERLAGLGVEHWIGYTRAHQALAQIEALFVHEPGKLRPRNLLIVGPTNNGKTMIAEKFRRTHPPYRSEDGEHEVIPVLMVQMPAEATATRLYTALLAALGTPIGLHGRNDIREALALRLMRAVGMRLLMIDEVHNLLAANARRQRELLNLLRFLGNELRIPLVCLGIRDAYLAIRSDDQLENRFHPLLLPPWELGEELARLLASFETVLPLREPSQLAAAPLPELILRRSEGTIGEIALLLARATATALRQEAERIDRAVLERTDYQPPSVRRRMVERELR